MRDDETAGEETFTIGLWNELGIASLQAAGADLRSALEATLRALLALMQEPDERRDECTTTQSAPLRGEGDDPSALVADLIEDLVVQSETFGVAPRDVSVDGVAHRDKGGFVAWGYARVCDDLGVGAVPLRLYGAPTVVDDQQSQVVIRVSLARDREHGHA